MANQDQSFLEDLERADPAYKFGKEYLAGMGIDIESGQPMMARQPNYDPEVMERLGIRMQGQVSQANQYSEPAGPASIYNEYGQPGAHLGFYRRASNWAARQVGKLAYGMAATTGLVSKSGLDQAYNVGEGATRGVLTQLIPGALSAPEQVMRWSEDMAGLGKMGMVEIMRSLADLKAKQDPDGAKEFYDQAAILESADPKDVWVASDAMEGALAKVVNPAQSEGEQAWRDVFSLVTSMFLTRNVGPKVGPNATRTAKLVENAIRGGITDFVISDPRRSGSVEAVLEMLQPELADQARNYVSGGGSEAEQELRLRLGRRFGEVGFGAVAGTVLDSVMAGFKGMRLDRIADDWRQVRSKVGDAPLTPEVEEQVTKILDDLNSLTNPEQAARVNAGAGAEAQAAGLPSVDGREMGLKVEGTETGPLPDAALGRLGQLPSAREWLVGRSEAEKRALIQTLDDALGEVNDIAAVGTRASRREGKEAAAEAGRKYRVGEEVAEREEMVEGMGEAPVEQVDEGMGQIADLQDEPQPRQGAAGYGQSPNRTADELFDVIDGTLSRNKEAGEMFGAVGKAGAEKVDYDQRLATNRAAKSVFDQVSGTTTLSEVADKLFASIDPNRIDFDTQDFDILMGDVADDFDVRPVSRGSAKEGVLAKGGTPEETSLRVVASKGASVDTDTVAQTVADLHGIDPEEARRIVDMAKVAVSDPTTATYAKVADATNQAPEKTVVDVAMAMNPFPESVVKDASGMNKPLFHGGPKAFDKMSDEFLGSGAGTNRYGKGHHFSDAELAGEYASKGEGGNIRKAYLDIRNPVDMDAPPSDRMMEVLEAEGRAMDVDPDDAMKDVYDRWIEDLTDEQGMELGAAKDYISAKFEEAGFDGLTYKFGDLGKGDDHEVWVAFHARQVRNAFGGHQGAVQEMAQEAAEAEKRTVSQAVQANVAGLESGNVAIQDALAQVLAAGKRQKMGKAKAAKMLKKALMLHDSPIVQAIANHPAVIEVAGAGALLLAMLWGMDNIQFGEGDDEVSKIGRVM